MINVMVGQYWLQLQPRYDRLPEDSDYKLWYRFLIKKKLYKRKEKISKIIIIYSWIAMMQSIILIHQGQIELSSLQLNYMWFSE